MIAAGSEKLASVPSGGAGGASAGAAAGGATADAPAEEEKEEGTSQFPSTELLFTQKTRALTYSNREGGVRRGYGLRSLRLSDLSQKICKVTIPHEFRESYEKALRQFLHVHGVEGLAAHGWIGGLLETYIEDSVYENDDLSFSRKTLAHDFYCDGIL